MFKAEWIMFLLFCGVFSFFLGCQCFPCKTVQDQNKTFVDCRHLHLQTVPDDIPQEAFAVDLSYNNITVLENRHQNMSWQILNISFNQIVNIEANFFNQFRKLEVFVMQNNSIGILQTHTFCGATKLHSLDISCNNITEIEAHTFCSLPELNFVNVSNNRIRLIYEDSFSHLTSLRSLDISNNTLFYGAPKTNKLLSGAPNLEHLRIFGNVDETSAYTTDFPHEIFNYSHNIHALNMDGYMRPKFGAGFSLLRKLRYMKFQGYCRMITIFNETFKVFESSSLISLDLRNCYIAALGANCFWYFPKLQTLDLSSNHPLGVENALKSLYGLRGRHLQRLDISRLNDHTASNYKPLVTDIQSFGVRIDILYATDNFIQWVGSHAIAALRDVKELYLRGNAIATSYSTYLQLFSLKELRILSLSHQSSYDVLDNYNSGSSFAITTNAIFSPSRTISIQLSENIEYMNFSHLTLPISDKLPSTRFKGGSRLKTLDMSYSGLTTCNASSLTFRNLEYFSLSGNNCSDIRPELLANLPSLKYLHLNDANLKFILQSKTGELLLNLSTSVLSLSIAQNNLTCLTPNIFDGLPQLRNLDLSKNEFEFFPDEIYALNNLTFLDLSYNGLATLSNRDMAWLDSQVLFNGNMTLKIRKNSLSCTCDNLNFLKWLQKTNVNLDNNPPYPCSLDSGKIIRTDMTADELYQFERRCSNINNILLFSSVGCFAFVMLTLLISFSCYHNYWKILFYFYMLKRWMKQNYGQNPNMAPQFKYDAFIVHADEDFEWTCTQFALKLEEERGLKLCLPDRDFDIGAYIFDNIEHNLLRSKCVIILLSKNLLKSKWFRYQVMLTKYHVMECEFVTIVALFLERLPGKDLTEDFLSMWKYVKRMEVPRNTYSADAFWDTLEQNIRISM